MLDGRFGMGGEKEPQATVGYANAARFKLDEKRPARMHCCSPCSTSRCTGALAFNPQIGLPTSIEPRVVRPLADLDRGELRGIRMVRVDEDVVLLRHNQRRHFR